jgi:hypothetical protein
VGWLKAAGSKPQRGAMFAFDISLPLVGTASVARLKRAARSFVRDGWYHASAERDGASFHPSQGKSLHF